ncbi:hypothetical protein [Spirosoma telluris]|uniref:hypothetical protein n=1 Tax=Spirosoma telluris TaxID=2183553 RepID=UPI002FC30376
MTPNQASSFKLNESLSLSLKVDIDRHFSGGFYFVDQCLLCVKKNNISASVFGG